MLEHESSDANISLQCFSYHIYTPIYADKPVSEPYFYLLPLHAQFAPVLFWDLICCVGKKCWNTIPSKNYVINMLSIDESPSLFKGPKSYNAHNTCLLFLFSLVLFSRCCCSQGVICLIAYTLPLSSLWTEVSKVFC